jgi:hypothetical protein
MLPGFVWQLVCLNWPTCELCGLELGHLATVAPVPLDITIKISRQVLALGAVGKHQLQYVHTTHGGGSTPLLSQ